MTTPSGSKAEPTPEKDSQNFGSSMLQSKFATREGEQPKSTLSTQSIFNTSKHRGRRSTKFGFKYREQINSASSRQGKQQDDVANLEDDDPPQEQKYSTWLRNLTTQTYDSKPSEPSESTEGVSKKRKMVSSTTDSRKRAVPNPTWHPPSESRQPQRAQKAKGITETKPTAAILKEKNVSKHAVGGGPKKIKKTQQPAKGDNFNASIAFETKNEVSNVPAVKSAVSWPLSLYFTQLLVANRKGIDMIPMLKELSRAVEVFRNVALLPTEECFQMHQLISSFQHSCQSQDMETAVTLSVRLAERMKSLGVIDWPSGQDLNESQTSVQVFSEFKSYTKEWLTRNVDTSKLDDAGRATLLYLHQGMDDLKDTLQSVSSICKYWKKESQSLQCKMMTSNFQSMSTFLTQNSKSARQIQEDAISSLLSEFDKCIAELSPGITLLNSEEAVKAFRATLNHAMLAMVESF